MKKRRSKVRLPADSEAGVVADFRCDVILRSWRTSDVIAVGGGTGTVEELSAVLAVRVLANG